MANHSDDQLKQLSSRLDQLERLIQSQIQRIHALEVRLAAKPPAVPEGPPLATERAGIEQIGELAAAASTESQTAVEPMIESVKTGSSSPELKERVYQGSLESQIGGNLLNKVGMVAIILGMAFFLKYAIENHWIGETGRVMVGILTGLAFLAWGERLQRKSYRGYAITVLGGGIAILYFSIFAAFSFYRLLPQSPALLLMVLITMATVVMSLRYDSRTIAVFATVGGFLTPALLSTGRDNQVGLFIYIALLDSGVLGLAYFKSWRGLNLLAFLFTQLMFIAWSLSFYSPAKLWRTEFFLTLFFLLFALMTFLYNVAHRRKSSFRDLFLISMNGATYFLWTYGLLETQYFHYLGFYAVLMAAFFVGAASLVHRQAPLDSYLFLVLLGLGMTCLTLAIPIQLKQNWITIGWAVEALVLSWVGFRMENGKTRQAAVVVAALVVFRLLVFDTPFRPGLAKDFRFLFNQRAFTFLISVLAMFAMAYLYVRNREKLQRLERWLIAGLVVVANLLILFFLTTEITSSFEVSYSKASEYGTRRDIRSRMQLAISALWGFYSIVLVTIGIVRKFQPIRLLAIVLFGVTILKVFILDLQEMEKVYRIIASIGLGVVLLAVSMMYQKYRTQISDFVLK
jgi:uncharacterized membrane protein